MKMRRTLCLLLICLCLPLHGPAADRADTLQYAGVSIRSLTVRDTPSREGAVIGQVRDHAKVDIYDFTPEFLRIAYEGRTGYVLRTQVTDIVPINPSVTLPYGAVIHHQVATVLTNTNVYKDKEGAGGAWCTLSAGSAVSFWYIQDGWATVPYQREIGYVPVSALKGVTPVAPTMDYARPGDLLASFTSFYSTANTEMNRGRMVNIDVGCKYICITLQPGQQFSFNKVAGPYRRARGYMPAPVLINGASAPGYGGGTCQVSSTLYNVLLQLPQGITVLYRRPHGPSGAKYLPHGVDAAVGNDTLDLVFQNDFSFPVRIDARAKDGALFVALYKA
ncbi:MAG: VanW family protein [Oscillospiraceae bacterium]|jgi:hypothetical protein|nr:VanW family protein [Oscillospiraceae bacterium]